MSEIKSINHQTLTKITYISRHACEFKAIKLVGSNPQM